MSPLLALLTYHRAVRLRSALEAKRVATLAKNVGDATLNVFDAIIATLKGAPSDAVIVISVALTAKLLVSNQVIFL